MAQLHFSLMPPGACILCGQTKFKLLSEHAAAAEMHCTIAHWAACCATCLGYPTRRSPPSALTGRAVWLKEIIVRYPHMARTCERELRDLHVLRQVQVRSQASHGSDIVCMCLVWDQREQSDPTCQSRVLLGDQRASARAHSRGSSMYSTVSSSLMYSVHTLACTAAWVCRF